MGSCFVAEPLIILSCEHGGNEIPHAYRANFQGAATILASHRGWDPGALEVARLLAQLLAAPFFFFTTTSRLLIDTNRSLNHPRLFSEFSRSLPAEERQAITSRYYHGHRQRIVEAIDGAVASGRQVWHLAIHSFTPNLDGEERRADLGLLYDSVYLNEEALCRAWQTEINKVRPDLIVRRNYPYLGRSDSLAAWLRRRLDFGRYLGIEVELNQRLFTDAAAAPALAELLQQTLPSVLPNSLQPAGPVNSPGEEVVAIVDRKNRVVGATKRREMRRRNLIHRATYILVYNRQGQLFVQKRTMAKDLYPGYYDVATGGVVLSGESYEESARRELQEELGVTAELTPLFDAYFAQADNKVWGRVFRCRHDGPFRLQEAEVESGAFMIPAEILAADHDTFTPDGLVILARLQRLGNDH
jgi:predicted N-formylglutamate amidohydrolase/isopentenyldiphosphate isomerase